MAEQAYEVEIQVVGLEVRQTDVYSLLDIFGLVMSVPELARQLHCQILLAMCTPISRLSSPEQLTKMSFRGTPDALIPSPTSFSLS